MTTSWSGQRSSFPPAVRARILQRDPICRCTGCRHHDGRCARPATEADHVIPHAEGGSDHESNGQGLCRPCHQSKTLDEIARGRARKGRRRRTDPHPGLR